MMHVIMQNKRIQSDLLPIPIQANNWSSSEWNVPDSKKVAAYLKAEKAFKKTFEDQRYGKEIETQQVVRKYSPLVRPLLKPLNELNSKMKTTTYATTDADSVHPLETLTFNYLIAKQSGNLDNEFGIRPYKDGYYIGSKKVDIEDGELIFNDGDGPRYFLTPGLWELITKKSPTGYTSEDLECYGEIICDTNVYKYRNIPDGNKLKKSKSPKYTSIIAPLLYKYRLIQDKKHGTGLQKVVTKANNVEYVYWDNLDELLERLYILYGELKAGNTNPTIRNEIISIIQEFKEL